MANEGRLTPEAQAAHLDACDAEIKRLRTEAAMWKARYETVQRDFLATLNAPCPACGERY